MTDLKLGKGPMAPTDELDTLPTDAGTQIRFETRELQAVCPVTGQPDIYKCTIYFESTGHTIETKSLKLYFQTFQGQGILAEDLAAQIAQHVAKAAESPTTVEVVQNTRGGIITTVTSSKEPNK